MEAFATYPDLEGKVVVVMGIGQSGPTDVETWGNGAAIALGFTHNKATVFGCDISIAAAEFTARRLRERGGACDVMAADVTKLADVQTVIDSVMEKYDRIDILVNNVGMTISGDPATLEEAVWDKQIDINLKSVYLACHVVLPIMQKQGFGSIINNASIAGIRYLGKPQVAYNAAKAAVIQFTKATACIYAPIGIRMNAVAPGLMHVPLVETLARSEDPGQQAAYRKIVENNVPMGHMGDAVDVANGVVFLSSASARYITGHTLVIDGGLTCSTGT
ncbi:3-oxoacyl-[acyl-carrier-protein] FabG [Cyphellophora attinorum]|uniref:3-oxoacyl-[acyl-carrier-protein] FabG n=1 Tax=Cyphellophora attinorum TaxID=1664694 RepID=A0A0N0NND4_9EURO|nr:3-oxoacyl-[acyl-carrier-protein] FabG [Phialophora attinorum]KPI41398.1 3-oxoacyl-[acyl-carrier-protein] FabG [Phialophora attinorum]